MGYAPDSGTIRDAITTAEERGLSVSFQASSLDMGHPNVAEIKMKGKSGRMATVVGRSLGGGRVMITEIDGFPVEITGEEYTLLTNHNDVPGIVADVGKILAEEHVNISNMRVFRKGKGTAAVMIIHSDQKVPESVICRIKEGNKNINSVMTLDII